MEENSDSKDPKIVLTQININHVEHLHVNDIQSSGGNVANTTMDIEQRRQAIRMYVDKLRDELKDEYREVWPGVWNEIIVGERLCHIILAVGKQKEATFNRSLVAHIIHFLGADLGMMKNYNASKLAEILEGSVNHSVRASLGMNPEKEIREIVREIVSRACNARK